MQLVLYFTALLLERRLFINSTISHDFQAVFQAYSFKHSGNPTAAAGLVIICNYPLLSGVLLGGSAVKNLPAMQEMLVQSLRQEDPLEKGMATQSNILAWRIPWTEEPGRPWSIGSQDSDTTKVTYHACMHAGNKY